VLFRGTARKERRGTGTARNSVEVRRRTVLAVNP
jgi:hypothetical protein